MPSVGGMRLPSTVPAPTPEDFTSPVHHRAVVVRLGLWLAVTFTVCFATGLVSHLHQHPVGWLPLPTSPAWGYRVTQGVHVASGTASVPLLLAKLYAAYPRLFERPVLGSPLRMLERVSVAVLVASSILMVTSGVANVAQWYVFGFGFTRVHWAFAWVTVGALAVHVAVKLPAVREAFAEGDRTAVAQEGRRAFVVGSLAVAAGAVLLTVGSSVRPLEGVSLLRSRRPSTSPLGVPVNRTAAAAGIPDTVDPSDDESWLLVLRGPRSELTLSAAQVRELPVRTVNLPIACVEGWSTGATWVGVRLADLLEMVGGVAGDVRVVSAERRGTYRESVLPREFAAHPETLLAMSLNGRRLTRDHGFPLRLIAPDRPGVLQTKWVQRLEVLQ